MISRRDLLQLGGVGALGLALPGGLRAAFAQGAAGPVRRLILISHCHGWPYDGWKMIPKGRSTNEPASYDLTSLEKSDFSRALAPLYAHRKRLLALDGLGLVSAELDQGGNRHDRGWVHAWTGNNANFAAQDTRSTSASLDQIVAASIGRSDRLPSLELSVDAALESGRPVAYGPSGDRLPVEKTPAGAWQRLFGATATGDAIGRRRQASLDFAHAEYAAIASSLDPAGRQRLAAHYDLVRRLGGRLRGLATLACTPSARPAASFEKYDKRFDAFADVIGAAFSCDIVRVVTLTLGEMPTADFGAAGISDKVHKGIAHYIYDDPKKYAAMVSYVEHHARQIARLVRTLEQLPDAGGRTVMDNTLIVWGSELGDGWHGYGRYNATLIGGSWAFKTGRYLYWPHRTPARMRVPASVIPSGWTRTAGIPHQKMLVSVARAMGLKVDRIGLGHVRGQTGAFIDTSGPLKGLTG